MPHGTGKILIAYLNGKLKAFIDTRISIVDIDDCIEAHLLGAERGADGERYLINSATMTSLEALELVTKISGVKHDVRLVPRCSRAASPSPSRASSACAARPRRCAAR